MAEYGLTVKNNSNDIVLELNSYMFQPIETIVLPTSAGSSVIYPGTPSYTSPTGYGEHVITVTHPLIAERIAICVVWPWNTTMGFRYNVTGDTMTITYIPYIIRSSMHSGMKFSDGTNPALKNYKLIVGVF